jgi:Flp pilus assembly protein TadB
MKYLLWSIAVALYFLAGWWVYIHHSSLGNFIIFLVLAWFLLWWLLRLRRVTPQSTDIENPS